MTRMLVVSSVLALAGTACTHAGRTAPDSAAQPATATPSATAQSGMAGMCPMDVPGTRVSAAETATGEALTFTTTPDQAPALRERVHAMAAMHNRHHTGDAGHGGMGGMHGGTMGGDAAHGGHSGTAEGGMKGAGMEGMQMPPPSRAAVEDLPDGARILVTPNDPADLERLQKTVRTHAEHMQQHGCAMMQHPHG
jgi:hypothetical protein